MRELLDLAATWDHAFATRLARANRLGPCKAGEVLAAEAGIYRDCADELRTAIVSAFGPGSDPAARLSAASIAAHIAQRETDENG